MNTPKVSIIVPVYKVEKYLNRAVDSLLCQKYKNLEIILINDGSPDRCPDICEKYAEQDSRVKVIHQKNAGLSAARNSGLEIATGEYLTFIDSDDFVGNEYVSQLVEGLESSGADVACCGINIVDDTEKIYDSFSCDKTFEESGIEVAKKMLCDDYPHNFSCAKLFKRKLFEGITYPVGRLYEDKATTYRAVARAERVVCISPCLYFYFRGREGNITSELQSPKAAWSYYCGCINCQEYLKFCNNDYFREILPDVQLQMYNWSKLCIESAICTGYKSYMSYCRKVETILHDSHIKIPFRLRMILALRTLYYFLYPRLKRN